MVDGDLKILMETLHVQESNFNLNKRLPPETSIIHLLLLKKKRNV